MLPGKEVDGSELVFAGPEPRMLLPFTGRPQSKPLSHSHPFTQALALPAGRSFTPYPAANLKK